VSRHPIPETDPFSMEEHLEVHHDLPLAHLVDLDGDELRDLHDGIHYSWGG
jgi:hypothetical protein